VTRRASKAAALLGRRGRAVNSAAQQDAARANGARGGRPVQTREILGVVAHGETTAVSLPSPAWAVEPTTPAAARWLKRHGWRCVWVRS
jgi:hypothetical protein